MPVRKITDGTPIGDVTAGGGLVAALDGITSQAAASCARKTNTNTCWIGLTLPKPTHLNKIIVVGASDDGYVTDVFQTQIELMLMGKVGALGTPPSGTGWVHIGTSTFAITDDFEPTGTNPFTVPVAASHKRIYYDHVALIIEAPFVSNRTMNVAELEVYEQLNDGGVVALLI